MKRKNILTLTAATFAMIGAGTIFFNAMAETALAARAGQWETAPTRYQVSASPTAVLPDFEEMDQKVNYHVSMNKLNTGTPTEMDLTMEEAAEIGAQYLKDFFDLDMEGAYVYMMYNPGTVTFPQPFWSGVVLYEKEQTPESTKWGYMVDAMTGELFNVTHDRHLDATPSLGLDSALEKNYDIYAEMAEEIAVEHKLLSGSVDRVEYNCQGYSGNDPTIAVDVIGENGESINMSFSRYDQKFLGLGTDTSRRISESALENILENISEGDGDVISGIYQKIVE